jgi:hypothetical protein
MIFGPKDRGTYVTEFRTADGEALAISIPRSEGARDPVLPGADAVQVIRAGGAERIADPRADVGRGAGMNGAYRVEVRRRCPPRTAVAHERESPA